jgi:hypothetical protein
MKKSRVKIEKEQLLITMQGARKFFRQALRDKPHCSAIVTKR